MKSDRLPVIQTCFSQFLGPWRRVVVAMMLVMVLFVTGCQSKTPSPYAQVQRETAKSVAVAKEATQGSNFNKLFPSPSDGYERIYTQEKKGFAEAKLKKAGQDVAMLSVSDTTSIPSAAAKYANATAKIGGYPAVTVGNGMTSVLVGKYQVKVQSRVPTFSADDRAAWIAKFDLRGIEKLN
jgi:hypothetical protein